MRLARGAMPGGQKTMEGRIEIAPIENPRHRRITYAKRKAGLVRKATELAVLCDADVAVLMCNADQKLSVYSSISVDDVLERFSHFEGIPEAFEASPPRPPPVCALLRRPLDPSRHRRSSRRESGGCRQSTPLRLALRLRLGLRLRRRRLRRHRPRRTRRRLRAPARSSSVYPRVRRRRSWRRRGCWQRQRPSSARTGKRARQRRAACRSCMRAVRSPSPRAAVRTNPTMNPTVQASQRALPCWSTQRSRWMQAAALTRPTRSPPRQRSSLLCTPRRWRCLRPHRLRWRLIRTRSSRVAHHLAHHRRRKHPRARASG